MCLKQLQIGFYLHETTKYGHNQHKIRNTNQPVLETLIYRNVQQRYRQQRYIQQRYRNVHKDNVTIKKDNQPVTNNKDNVHNISTASLARVLI